MQEQLEALAEGEHEGEDADDSAHGGNLAGDPSALEAGGQAGVSTEPSMAAAIGGEGEAAADRGASEVLSAASKASLGGLLPPNRLPNIGDQASSDPLNKTPRGRLPTLEQGAQDAQGALPPLDHSLGKPTLAPLNRTPRNQGAEVKQQRTPRGSVDMNQAASSALNKTPARPPTAPSTGMARAPSGKAATFGQAAAQIASTIGQAAGELAASLRSQLAKSINLGFQHVSGCVWLWLCVCVCARARVRAHVPCVCMCVVAGLIWNDIQRALCVLTHTFTPLPPTLGHGAGSSGFGCGEACSHPLQCPSPQGSCAP